jgi:lipoprotein-anchoring transpeptidase ErfK/SrfK
VSSKTLSGDGYEYENVQWLLYFYQGYAIHGAYWHNNFGIPVSHGCVNMTNADAEWFFNFAEVGTPVTVIK